MKERLKEIVFLIVHSGLETSSYSNKDILWWMLIAKLFRFAVSLDAMTF